MIGKVWWSLLIGRVYFPVSSTAEATHTFFGKKRVLVVGEGARTLSEPCRGALEQSTGPTNALIGP